MLCYACKHNQLVRLSLQNLSVISYTCNKLDWLEYFFLRVLSKDYKLLTLRNRPYCRRPPCFKWWFSFSAVWSWRIHKGKELLDNCKLKIIRPNIVLFNMKWRNKKYQHWRNKILVTDISKNVCMVLIFSAECTIGMVWGLTPLSTIAIRR